MTDHNSLPCATEPATIREMREDVRNRPAEMYDDHGLAFGLTLGHEREVVAHVDALTQCVEERSREIIAWSSTVADVEAALAGCPDADTLGARVGMVVERVRELEGDVRVAENMKNSAIEAGAVSLRATAEVLGLPDTPMKLEELAAFRMAELRARCESAEDRVRELDESLAFAGDQREHWKLLAAGGAKTNEILSRELTAATQRAAALRELWAAFISAEDTIFNAGYMDNHVDAARARERQQQTIAKARAALAASPPNDAIVPVTNAMVERCPKAQYEHVAQAKWEATDDATRDTWRSEARVGLSAALAAATPSVVCECDGSGVVHTQVCCGHGDGLECCGVPEILEAPCQKCDAIRAGINTPAQGGHGDG